MGFWRTFFFELPEYLEELTRDLRRSPSGVSERILRSLVLNHSRSPLNDLGLDGESAEIDVLKVIFPPDLPHSRPSLIRRLLTDT
jgi:hypothetical protein